MAVCRTDLRRKLPLRVHKTIGAFKSQRLPESWPALRDLAMISAQRQEVDATTLAIGSLAAGAAVTNFCHARAALTPSGESQYRRAQAQHESRSQMAVTWDQLTISRVRG